MTHSLYIHIPFCRERCTYCAFNTYTDRSPLIDGYVGALENEMTFLATLSDKVPVHTVYFGGGTPSLLSPVQIERILQAARRSFSVTDDVEISLEVNPGTVDKEYFTALVQLGANRFSLGVQSAQADELMMFGRLHDWVDVERGVSDARQAGVTNLSLDLIYGVPNQTLDIWQDSLQRVLDLGPDHLSLYALGLESGTEMTRQVKYGELPSPDPDLAADMYELASECLAAQGFIQYEISNWGKPGTFCQHNLQYWRNLPYLGIGAGAHGYANRTRIVNAMRPEDYMQRLTEPPNMTLYFPQTPATIKAEPINDETDQFESIFMGLRLINEGLSLATFEERYGFRLEDKYGEQVKWLKDKNLIIQKEDRLFLTPHARLISNLVFEQFVGEPAG
ncbi:MAG: radical SAM family heme chaperone HemW [Chloroflexi bacterium]|nr:radical SAM family heme chaperone HemW [Chloroflexota bacterium]